MKNLKGKLNNFTKIKGNLQKISFIKKLQKKYPKAEIFLVGGMVRDLFLGKKSKDFDFVIRNVSAKTLENFLKTQGQVNLVGKRFGVFKFKPKNWQLPEVDIALPRTEYSLNLTGGYRDFKIQSNPKLPIEKDLARRDFTINALALKIATRDKRQETDLVDPFDGLNNLEQKIIRAVGGPKKRFKEDYSRILRALRLTCQLNFKIEPKTWRAIKLLIKHLNDLNKNGEEVVASEVIAAEFLKSFYYNPIKALELWDKSGALKILIPELLKMKRCPQPKNFHSEGDVWQHTILCLKNLTSQKFKKEFSGSRADMELIMAVLFHDIGKPYTIKKTTDKIKTHIFYNHDLVGAELTEKILTRRHASSPPEFGVKAENVAWLVKKHLLLIHGDIRQIKNTTLEKYFFRDPNLGLNLQKLIFIDAISTLPPSGQPNMKLYKILKKKLNNLKILSRKKGQITKNLVNGHDLMKNFKLKESPKIGKLLEILREAQLQGKIKNKIEGLKYIKRYL